MLALVFVLMAQCGRVGTEDSETLSTGRVVTIGEWDSSVIARLCVSSSLASSPFSFCFSSFVFLLVHLFLLLLFLLRLPLLLVLITSFLLLLASSLPSSSHFHLLLSFSSLLCSFSPCSLRNIYKLS